MPEPRKKSRGNYTRKLPKRTCSLCPVCISKIPARIFEKAGKVLMEKTCPRHGKFSETYFSDAKMYERFRKFGFEGSGVKNPNVLSRHNCPFDCGLCENHKSHTALVNLAVTNRCDLRCWYCFYYAKEGENVYEPSLDKIKHMLWVARNQRPVAPVAIQITGGNPELRKDLPEIAKLCQKEGFLLIQVNTQGTHRLYKDLKFMKSLAKAGVSTIYLSFDGIGKKTNPKNHWEVPYILENARKSNIAVILVPTIVKGVNDHEIGSIINFALNNIDVVRGVNFQPVSLVGRMPRKYRERQRITIPEVIQRLEEQSSRIITKKDFYPIPSVNAISKFVSEFSGTPQYSFSTHFACGAATYIFLCGKKVVPVTSFVDVEGLFRYLNKLSTELEKGANKNLLAMKALLSIRKFINEKKEPKKLNIYKALFDTMIKHDFDTLSRFHQKSLFIGIMHFMDLYNYDVERVQRCCIHYLMPDGRIVPFCTFNVMPEHYRDNIQKKFSITSKEWEKKNKTKLMKDIYRRNAALLEKGRPYRRTYGKTVNYFEAQKKKQHPRQ